MLILKVFVNLNQIDEIHIQNTGKVTESGLYLYKIRMPQGFQDWDIPHRRESGYMGLVETVMDILETAGYSPEESYVRQDEVSNFFRGFVPITKKRRKK